MNELSFGQRVILEEILDALDVNPMFYIENREKAIEEGGLTLNWGSATFRVSVEDTTPPVWKLGQP